MPLETVASADYKFPVIVSYTCPKCGNEARVSEEIVVQTSIRGSMSAKDAETLLRNGLPSDAQDQIKRISENWERGILGRYAINSGVHYVRPQCPRCHLYQVLHKDGKILALHGGKGALASIGKFLPLLLTLGWGVGMGVVLSGNPMQPMGFLYVTRAFIAALALHGFWARSVHKRAFRDPAYMEKHFCGVLNDEVYADFTPYGLGKIRVNSKK